MEKQMLVLNIRNVVYVILIGALLFFSGMLLGNEKRKVMAAIMLCLISILGWSLFIFKIL